MADQKLATLLSQLFAAPSPAAAVSFLTSKSVSAQQRSSLAKLASLSHGWVTCDQSVPGNAPDLAGEIAAELYEPFWFYRRSLALGPRELFEQRRATGPLKKKKTKKDLEPYWVAQGGTARQAFLPASPAGTFDAVVHFVQAGSGTGVHVGGGRVLTCAHVVDSRDDDGDEDDGGKAPPGRIGRRKVVVFGSGRAFVATCVAAEETSDGSVDVAVVVLGAEVDLANVPPAPKPKRKRKRGGPEPEVIDLCGDDEGSEAEAAAAPLGVAAVASSPVELGDRLFCVGNPSNVDLESISNRHGAIEFEPPTWHTSVGECQGYADPAVRALREEQSARGRAPTRGEVESVAGAEPLSSAEGSYLQHSCWTYWGHSGAPLFNEGGEVAGLHCAWDDGTGMRHGQKLEDVRRVLEKAKKAKKTN
ncbi:hypothetical protein TeGR_g5710 [Tetraparma gracilis]|uniref:Serine protease n=1 Tax=Tetraparma gracilis TaxID=2962635 RepID=A0ABQ6MBT8_9STRA|nr:hypothetical protein TeGR_g5710 [Tetraparma gracilis]